MIPSSALHSTIVPHEYVKPMPMRIAPKLTPRNDSQFAGPTLGRIKFCDSHKVSDQVAAV